MDRVAPVSPQIPGLRRPAVDEPPQPTDGEDRAERMQARPAVGSDRRHVSEPEAVVVQERPARGGHLGHRFLELAP